MPYSSMQARQNSLPQFPCWSGSLATDRQIRHLKASLGSVMKEQSYPLYSAIDNCEVCRACNEVAVLQLIIGVRVTS